VVLDLGLPDGDGRALLGDLQSNRNKVPVLVLTARDAVEDRVSGLDAEVDDYLVKPFATAEVIARLRALLRRPGGALGMILQAGNLSFDTIGRDGRVGGDRFAAATARKRDFGTPDAAAWSRSAQDGV
jgi:DNA-binding response OmpR family regulator